jgi:hypothetical protein
MSNSNLNAQSGANHLLKGILDELRELDLSVITLGTINAVGPDAVGAAPTENPVQISGFDGTNVRRIKTDTGGELQVDVLSIAAGSNIIGNFRVDQTTLGTTNGVAPKGIDADNAVPTVNPLFVAKAVDTATYAPSYAAGDMAVPAIDKDSGAMLVNQGALNYATDSVSPPPSSRANSAALEASRLVKATAGRLISLIGYNSKASAQFVQVHDATSVPADTAIPAVIFTVPASSNFSLDVPVTGMNFTNGIAVSNSSTGPTKTIGSADCWFTASYI